jgi:putative radical SAM enzyme (TIGR03279 family)
MSCKITEVEKTSPAAMAGIEAGAWLVSINDHIITDVLDYHFYSTHKRLKLILEDENSVQFVVRIEKAEYEPVGLSFETYLIDEPKSCHNKCIFCFIDQMPQGMRKTLYFKDDDTRLSFLMGNYVTLTNISDKDLKRIVEQRISPINISVQATNPSLRCKMLGNRFAGDILSKMKQLQAGRISMNCQIVLCCGINDKEELTRSLLDLCAMYPAVNSVSVVPAGLSKYREGLYPLQDFSKEEASSVINQIDEIGERYLKNVGSRVVYAADEFYIKAQRPLPSEQYYEDFPQIENGVGLITSFLEEFYGALSNSNNDELQACRGNYSIATGKAFYSFICSLVDDLVKKCNNLHITIYEINNNFFGEKITVSGLLTGQDLKEQLEGKPLGEKLFIASSMLKSDEDIFLDDMTLNQLSERLGVEVCAVEPSGYALFEALTG